TAGPLWGPTEVQVPDDLFCARCRFNERLCEPDTDQSRCPLWVRSRHSEVSERAPPRRRRLVKRRRLWRLRRPVDLALRRHTPCPERIDAGDDCIAARIGIAIERLSRSSAGVRA